MRCRLHGLGEGIMGSRPFAKLRVPKIFNLRADPFEAADESMFYDRWSVDLNYNSSSPRRSSASGGGVRRSRAPRQPSPLGHLVSRATTRVQLPHTRTSGASARPIRSPDRARGARTGQLRLEAGVVQL